MIQGKGIYIWQLRRCEGGDMAKVVSRLKAAGMTHVMPKIADGTDSDINGNWQYLPALVDLCHKAGIQVIGWQYVYGANPTGEANRAITELRKLPFDGFVINAERQYRDLANNAQAAKTYCEKLRAAFPDLLLGLSTYRFPHYHPRFPFAAFLEYCDFNMPQVYWMQSNGTVPAQLANTIKAYEPYPQRPMIPTGAAFEEHGWKAVPSDQRIFVEEVRKHGLSGCNWWEYWEAFHRNPELGNMIIDTPFEEVIVEKLFSARCIISSLNIRRGPGVNHEAVGWLSQGDIVDVYEVTNGWYRIGVNRWVSGHASYMERLPDDQPLPDTDPLTRLYYPCDERWPISQVFGANPQWYPNTKGHNGIDFAIPVGNPIYAAEAGDVIVAREETSGYGRHVRIRHSHGITIYGHLSKILVKVGNKVQAKQVLGLSGGATDDPYSGMSTGPHLHFEYRWDIAAPQVPGGYLYNAVDPLPLLVSHDDAEAIFRARCIVDSLRVRTLPSTSGAIVGHLVRGQEVNVYQTSENDWFRIGVGRWCSGDPAYMERIEIVKPPDPDPEPMTLEERVADNTRRIEALEAK